MSKHSTNPPSSSSELCRRWLYWRKKEEEESKENDDAKRAKITTSPHARHLSPNRVIEVRNGESPRRRET